MKKFISSVLCIMLTLTALLPLYVGAGNIPVIGTDVSSPSTGCVFLGIEGKYITQPEEALKRINEIRYEACVQGVKNPSTGKRLKVSDYVPIKWSSDLEYIARIRASEAGITMAHERTSGKYIFDLKGPNGSTSWGEVIAWNWSETMVCGIDQWYEEKSDWVNETPGAVTGHYTQMIDPEYRYVGLASFCTDTARFYNTTVGEFSYDMSMDESLGSNSGKCIQTLDVSKSILTGKYEIFGKTGLKVGESSVLSLRTSVSVKDYRGSDLTTDALIVLGAVSWTSSNTNVASVSENGTVTALSCGNSVITARDPDGNKVQISVTVEHAYQTSKICATPVADGKTENVCGVCGYVGKTTKIYKASDITLSKTSFVYNGKLQQPKVTVKDCNGKTISSKHYTVKYSSGCKNVGEYKVKITFKGNYSGSKTLKFKIVPQAPANLKASKITKSSMTVSWDKVSGAKTYTVYRSTDGKTWKAIVTTEKTSFNITKLKSNTAYKYKVKAADESGRLRSAYSKTLSARTDRS